MFRFVQLFIKDCRKYRHYMVFAVKSNLKAELSNTVLGYFWWLLDPLLHMLIYTFLVQVVFRRATPAYPVYLFCALLPWKVATTTMGQSSRCIRGNAGIIKQIYLPKFILPLVILLTNSIKFFFGLFILGAMLWVYHIPLTWHVLEFFLVFLSFVLFFYSLGLFLAHIGVLFDDMSHLVGYIIMFWYFASPGIWHPDQMPAKIQNIIWLNPNTSFFMSFRNTLMYGQPPHYNFLALWTGLSLVLLIAGITLLYKSDKNYSKVI